MPTGRFPVGRCRWCGESTVIRPARNWHPRCVDAYRLAVFAGDARSALRRAAPGRLRCGECGTALGGRVAFEADHTVPLWLAPTGLALGDRHLWWGMGNLRALCVPCHTVKTSREAALRAAMRELEKLMTAIEVTSADAA